MGTALMIASLVGSVALAISIGLLKDEAAAWLPTLTRSVLRSAVQRLPVAQRDRYAEEWSSHIDEYPGKLSQLSQAMLFIFAAGKLYRDHKKSGNISAIEEARRQLRDIDRGTKFLSWGSPGLAISATCNYMFLNSESGPPLLIACYFVGALGIGMTLAWRLRFRDEVRRQAYPDTHPGSP